MNASIVIEIVSSPLPVYHVGAANIVGPIGKIGNDATVEVDTDDNRLCVDCWNAFRPDQSYKADGELFWAVAEAPTLDAGSTPKGDVNERLGLCPSLRSYGELERSGQL